MSSDPDLPRRPFGAPLDTEADTIDQSDDDATFELKAPVPWEAAQHAFQQGDYQRTIALLTATELPLPDLARLHLARSYAQLHQYTQALKTAARALLSPDPNSAAPDFYAFLSEELLSLGRPEDALACAVQALDLRDNMFHRTLLQRAEEAADEQKPSDLETLLHQLAADPYAQQSIVIDRAYHGELATLSHSQNPAAMPITESLPYESNENDLDATLDISKIPQESQTISNELNTFVGEDEDDLDETVASDAMDFGADAEDEASLNKQSPRFAPMPLAQFQEATIEVGDEMEMLEDLKASTQAYSPKFSRPAMPDAANAPLPQASALNDAENAPLPQASALNDAENAPLPQVEAEPAKAAPTAQEALQKHADLLAEPFDPVEFDASSKARLSQAQEDAYQATEPAQKPSPFAPTLNPIAPQASGVHPAVPALPPQASGVHPAVQGRPPQPSAARPTRPDMPPQASGVHPAVQGRPLQPSAARPTRPDMPPQPSGVHPRMQGLPPQPSGVRPQSQGLPPQPSGVHPRMQGLPPQASGIRPQSQGLPPQPSGVHPRMQGLPPQPSGVRPYTAAIPQESIETSFNPALSLAHAQPVLQAKKQAGGHLWRYLWLIILCVFALWILLCALCFHQARLTIAHQTAEARIYAQNGTYKGLKTAQQILEKKSFEPNWFARMGDSTARVLGNSGLRGLKAEQTALNMRIHAELRAIYGDRKVEPLATLAPMADATYSQILLQIDAGDLHQALVRIQALPPELSGRPDFIALRARIMAAQGDQMMARSLANRAAQSAPDDKYLMRYALELAVDAQDPAALSPLQQFVDGPGQDQFSARILLERLRILLKVRQDEAATFLKTLLSRPDDLAPIETAWAQEALGLYYEQLSQFEAAKIAYQAALKAQELPRIQQALARLQQEESAEQPAQP